MRSYVAYAHIGFDQTHGVPQFLICGDCCKVKEICIKPAAISALQTSVQEAGFELIKPQLEMNCLCEDCIAQVA